MAQERHAYVDAARGFAMLLVFLSHFGEGYFAAEPARRWTLEMIGMVASPTFIILSGFLVGLLATTSPRTFPTFRLKLLNRGLFLLVIGHVLCAGAHAWMYGGFVHALSLAYITDTIAICVIVGPFLVTRWHGQARLICAGAMYLGAWGLSVFWMPAELWVRVGKDFLLGSIDPVGILYGYPIAPWLAIYLLGSAVGDYAGRAHCSGNEREVNAVLLRAAIGSLFAALMVKGAYKAAAFFYPLDGSSLLYELSNPFTRVPPSPVYVGLFAGLGLLLIWALHQLHRSEICRSMINTIATIGRASLFAFILQYYLYLVVIYSLRAVLPGPAIAWYVLSVMGLYAACAVWDRRGWNRWLTVGFSTVSVPARITPAPQWTRT